MRILLVTALIILLKGGCSIEQDAVPVDTVRVGISESIITSTVCPAAATDIINNDWL
jgi:hypothetical protein